MKAQAQKHIKNNDALLSSFVICFQSDFTSGHKVVLESRCVLILKKAF